MSNPKTIDVDLSKLSAGNLKAVELLKEVGKVIHSIWEKQVNDSTNETNFYYEGVTADEVKEAAKKDPEILSPYTLVRKGKDGKLFAVPYSVEYADELAKITELLENAAEASDDKPTKKYLLELAKNYFASDFDKALITYVSTPETKLHVLMGPMETYLDELMGIKKAFQFNLRVMREDQTDDLNNILKLAQNVAVLRPVKSSASEVNVENVKISAVDAIMFSGRQYNTFPSSTNLPDDNELVKKYGTKVVFYLNGINIKFDSLLSKNIEKVKLDESVYDLVELKRAYLRLIALHEIAEAVVKYPDSRERLKGHMDEVREINAFLLGLKSAKYHVFSGYFTTDQFRQIFLCFVLYGLDVIERQSQSKSIKAYAIGFMAVFSYLQKVGALKIEGGKYSFDMSALAHMDNLTENVSNLFASGKYEDAKTFFEKYSNLED